jgi:glycosyltransferase involved in cell wall biosynthesis
LWAEGLEFELDVVGRINPHFGKPIAARLKVLQRRRRAVLRFHPGAGDETVRRLYASARASVFPTLAEGCGLPLLESLWLGVPCVCSDLPVLRENADGGGCLTVATNDPAAWKAALRTLLTGDALPARLSAEATARPLPTWRDAAATIATALRSSR